MGILEDALRRRGRPTRRAKSASGRPPRSSGAVGRSVLLSPTGGARSGRAPGPSSSPNASGPRPRAACWSRTTTPSPSPRAYERGGAGMLSVLTEPRRFLGADDAPHGGPRRRRPARPPQGFHRRSLPGPRGMVHRRRRDPLHRRRPFRGSDPRAGRCRARARPGRPRRDPRGIGAREGDGREPERAGRERARPARFQRRRRQGSRHARLAS